MWDQRILFVLGCMIHCHSVLAIWSCEVDADCISMAGSVCNGGECLCPDGLQSVLGGSSCVQYAPYHTSTCFEDFQCSRLFTNFECRKHENATSVDPGACFCQTGNHYFHGRCWPSTEWGQACTRDEQCMFTLRDPFSMSCSEGTCDCAEGYYLRQRGECRKSALAVGDACVLDEDCQFEGGACQISTFTCVSASTRQGVNESRTVAKTEAQLTNVTGISLTRQHGVQCTDNSGCTLPFECSSSRICTCPLGYYPNGAETICLAELGSPVSSPNQCVGLFTEMHDGICTCQTNFYYDETMRGCVKPAVRANDFCSNDENCHTFGAFAMCGLPQQWGLRNCECIPEHAVWNANRQMCMLFAGIGERCEVDSDCLAGELEIQCELNDDGLGVCSCPEEYEAIDGLCLLLGQELGDSCQVDLECAATVNAVCVSGNCSCGNGYQQLEDFCAPVIGGTCNLDSDCMIEDTICSSASNTCQCRQEYVESGDSCWPVVSGFGVPCNVSVQCATSMGDLASCSGERCVCHESSHYRDGRCWERTGIFEQCDRTSQCFLEESSDMVHCRNSMCQCVFEYPYSEELGTCRSSAATALASFLTLIISLSYLYLS